MRHKMKTGDNSGYFETSPNAFEYKGRKISYTIDGTVATIRINDSAMNCECHNEDEMVSDIKKAIDYCDKIMPVVRNTLQDAMQPIMFKDKNGVVHKQPEGKLISKTEKS